jgi:hypothetical protein
MDVYLRTSIVSLAIGAILRGGVTADLNAMVGSDLVTEASGCSTCNPAFHGSVSILLI